MMPGRITLIALVAALVLGALTAAVLVFPLLLIAGDDEGRRWAFVFALGAYQLSLIGLPILGMTRKKDLRGAIIVLIAWIVLMTPVVFLGLRATSFG